MLTDDDQNVIVRYEYDVFGAIRSEVGTSDNPRKFTGKEYESDVKLYYYGARYYDPHIGRFVSRDPAGDGLNWYAYAFNNPLFFIDPTGLRAVNSTERSALVHTFGQQTGNQLGDIIDIVFDESLIERELGGLYNPDRPNEITLSTLYRTDGKEGGNLTWLSVFIHEVTHMWQHRTGKHRHGTPGEDYVYTNYQLLTNDLKSEEHAKAVETWFYVGYGLANNLIVANPMLGTEQVSYTSAWITLLRPLGWSDERIRPLRLNRDVWQSSKYLQGHINFFFKAVVLEIKSTLGQNFPNPL